MDTEIQVEDYAATAAYEEYENWRCENYGDFIDFIADCLKGA